jgi:hypothetical protein
MLGTQVTKPFMLAPDIFSIIISVFFPLRSKMCTSLHAPNSDSERFTGDSRIVGPQVLELASCHSAGTKDLKVGA